MAKKKSGFKFDKKSQKFIDEFEDRLETAREKSAEAMGMVWADNSKLITLNEKHVQTGAYVNSIGYASNFSDKDGNQGGVGQIIHDMNNETHKTVLTLGSGVEYAEVLEKKYNIMARGLDSSLDDMNVVGTAQVKKVLLG